MTEAAGIPIPGSGQVEPKIRVYRGYAKKIDDMLRHPFASNAVIIRMKKTLEREEGTIFADLIDNGE